MVNFCYDSNLKRCTTGYNKSSNNVWQTDYIPRGGMSVGPVFDMRGMVVGLVSGYADNGKGVICGFSSDILNIMGKYCNHQWWDAKSSTWKTYKCTIV